MNFDREVKEVKLNERYQVCWVQQAIVESQKRT